MENEMIFETEAMEPEFEIANMETESSGIGAGAVLAIVTGVAAAIGAAVVFGKKAWDKHKAKKELHLVDEHDFVEPTDEEIAAVTGK